MELNQFKEFILITIIGKDWINSIQCNMHLKDQIKELIQQKKFNELLEMKERPSKLILILMRTLYNEDPDFRFGAAYVLGRITSKIYSKDPERVKEILQKLLWSLNDESGFVCWGAPEAIGEIVKDISELKTIYAQFLISFLSHPNVIFNNNALEKGALIGLARIGKLEDHLLGQLKSLVKMYMDKDDQEMQEYAFWCGIMAGLENMDKMIPDHLDTNDFLGIYENGIKIRKPISELL